MMGVQMQVFLLPKSILIEMRGLHLSKEKTMGEWVLVAIVLLIISLNQGGGGIQILEHSSPKKVEYIHFLDSDDWLELNCIEECVRGALESRSEIVWHDFKIFNEISRQITYDTFLKELNLEDNKLLSGLQIFQQLKQPSFSWTWPGLIETRKVENMRFELGIESEDAIFGMQLFALSHKIAILRKELMYYRIRSNSISQHTLVDKTSKGITFPPHQQDLVQAFGSNIYNIRHYQFAYSCAIICLKMDEFLKKEKLHDDLRKILKTMIEVRAIYAFGGCGFEKDPRNVREICSKLLNYTSRIRWSSKLAYHYPRVFRILKKIKALIRG